MFASTGQGFIGFNMFAYCLNNPISNADKSGTSTEAADAWAATMWWLWSIDGFFPFGDAIYVIGYIGLVVFCATTLTASQNLSESTAEVKVMAVAPGGDAETYYTVYFLCSAEDPNRAIIYVGRVKTENYDARMWYHRMRGREEVARIDGLTYAECRYVEQAGMVYFHTIGKGETYKNQIRGIGPSNPKRFTYIMAGQNLISSRLPEDFIFPDEYLANLTEEELLNGGM